MTMLKPIPVLFDQAEHTYTNTETGEQYRGITSTLIRRLFPDKYEGISPEVLNAAASRGTLVHSDIELIESIGVPPSTDEGADYLRLKEKNGLRYLESEYTVSDLKHYATNIDIIYDAGENMVDLADFKTTSTFDRESVSWQLSICAYLLTLNNPHITVRNLYGIWLRDGRAQLIGVPIREDADILALMEADQAGKPIEFAPMIPDYIADREARLYDLGTRIREMTAEYDALKEEVLAGMVEHNEKSIDTGNIRVTVLAPTERETFDSKRFQADNPDLYSQYAKRTETKQSLKITLR